jgi:class 3 adenylate cyclase
VKEKGRIAKSECQPSPLGVECTLRADGSIRPVRWETALATERVERGLAALLAADVAGYSRLIGADEEGTLARLKEHRRELIDPKIAEHRGRIVKTSGDGMLVEFASVVDALRCATEVRVGMASRMPRLYPTGASIFVSESIWAMWSSRTATFLVTP